MLNSFWVIAPPISVGKDCLNWNKNVLHLAVISLVIPLSNAKAECVYSFLWSVYTKEWTWLNNSTLEDILWVRDHCDFSDEKYGKAIELFMTKKQVVQTENVQGSQRDTDIHQTEKQWKKM